MGRGGGGNCSFSRPNELKVPSVPISAFPGRSLYGVACGLLLAASEVSQLFGWSRRSWVWAWAGKDVQGRFALRCTAVPRQGHLGCECVLRR